MSFTSLSFVFLFLPLCCVAFYNCDKLFADNIRLSLPGNKERIGSAIDTIEENAKRILLAAISGLFVFMVDKFTFLLLLPLLAIGYVCRHIICKFNKSKYSGWILFFSIAITLLPLLVCKYLDYILLFFNISFKLSEHIIVPIGISFFTFRLIMVLVDTYKDDCEMKLFDYVSYVLFFPQFTSGPIEKTKSFLEWTRSDKFGVIDYSCVSDGIVRIIIGLSKKVLVANMLSDVVDSCFSYRAESNSTMALFAILGYSLQIYFDFSGYSDIAIGAGYLLGFKSIENFDSPYRARTIGEFWKKWHISLTKFFTAYIYIPLGGNRKGLKRTCINIMIVFLISGLWHGSNARFVIWGAIYGLILVIERVFKISPDKVNPIIGRIVTLIIVSLLWTFFRAESLGAAVHIVREFLAFDFKPITQELIKNTHIPELDFAIAKLGVSENIYNIWPYVILFTSLFISQFKLNSRELCEQKVYFRRIVFIFLLVMAVISVLSFSSNESFIYWNF